MGELNYTFHFTIFRLSPQNMILDDKESKILHRRLAEHRANMQTTLTGIKHIIET